MRRKGLKKVFAGLISTVCAVASLYPVNIQAQVETEVTESYQINEYIHNEILVQIEEDCSENARKQLFSSAGVSVEKSADDCFVVKAGSQKSLKSAIASLEASKEVKLVQPNFCYEVDKENYAVPLSLGGINILEEQWSLKNNGTLEFDDYFRFNGKSYGDSVKEVAGIDGNVIPLWEAVEGQIGKEVVVAVIDSGVDIAHPAFQGKLWKNIKEVPGDHVDNDGNGYTDDYDGWNAYSLTTNLKDELGHGTHCAGIIAANGTDDVWGVTGKSNVKLMPVKVFNDVGSRGDESLYTTSFAIRCGIKYAEKNGADICNVSLGMKENDELLQETMRQSKMLFVCAAGNEGNDLSRKPCYPGNYTFDNVITVGNIRCDGKLHLTSNYNKDLVPVVAPGTEIYSTMPSGEYDFMSGTSMATPYVAGIAAMLYSYVPHMNASSAKKQICKTAKQFSNLAPDIGYGLVDAYAAYANDVCGPVLRKRTTTYKSKGYVEIKLGIYDQGASGVSKVCFASGSKSRAYFEQGLMGKEVQPDGTIIIKKSGFYTLYAIDNKGNDSWLVINVTIPTPKSVRVSRASVTLKRGTTYTLKPTVSPSGVYTTYTFSSSDTAVARVNEKGKITARKRGTATITVRTRNGKRCTCKITVK